LVNYKYEKVNKKLNEPIRSTFKISTNKKTSIKNGGFGKYRIVLF